jgi:DNA-directed RNA polymerase specialized sigma24 family protein
VWSTRPTSPAETFLAAFRKRDRYDPERAGVRTWRYGFATNLAGKHRRSEPRALRAMDRRAPRPDPAWDRLDQLCQDRMRG